jgi:hypothetical protein
MKAEGVEKIEWLTAMDERVRGKDAPFPHDILHNQTVKIGEYYNNGESIRYPQDTSASPSNIINCRCVSVKAGG